MVVYGLGCLAAANAAVDAGMAGVDVAGRIVDLPSAVEEVAEIAGMGSAVLKKVRVTFENQERAKALIAALEVFEDERFVHDLRERLKDAQNAQASVDALAKVALTLGIVQRSVFKKSSNNVQTFRDALFFCVCSNSVSSTINEAALQLAEVLSTLVKCTGSILIETAAHNAILKVNIETSSAAHARSMKKLQKQLEALENAVRSTRITAAQVQLYHLQNECLKGHEQAPVEVQETTTGKDTRRSRSSRRRPFHSFRGWMYNVGLDEGNIDELVARQKLFEMVNYQINSKGRLVALGTLDLRDPVFDALTELPNLEIVSGSVYMNASIGSNRASSLQWLPPVSFQVQGTLELVGCDLLEQLPQTLACGGDLILSGCTKLKELPKDLSVGGSVDLKDCSALESLPENLRINGTLNLSGCTKLQALPEGLQVSGALLLVGCTSLTSLPVSYRVGGDLDLRGCVALCAKDLPASSVEGRVIYK